MPYVNVHIDGQEVLDELDDDELQKEVAKRERKKAPTGCAPETDDWLLQQIYEHYRLHDNAPRCLSEYIWRKLGKVI
jgi:hypothetical protein